MQELTAIAAMIARENSLSALTMLLAQAQLVTKQEFALACKIGKWNSYTHALRQEKIYELASDIQMANCPY